MSWQDDAMIEQEQADALEFMGEGEWRELYGKDKKMDETLKILEGEETNDPDESRVLRDE